MLRKYLNKKEVIIERNYEIAEKTSARLYGLVFVTGNEERLKTEAGY